MYDFSNTYYSLSNWKFLVILRSFSNTPIRLAPPPPREAYLIKSHNQALLEKETNGSYKSGHLGIIDTDKTMKKVKYVLKQD